MRIFDPAVSSNRRAHARFTQAQVIIALAEAAGVVALAARQLACSRATTKNYIARHPAVRQALHAVRAQTCARAESPLVDGVMRGDIFASIKYLQLFSADYGRRHAVHEDPLNGAGLAEDEIELIDDL